MDSVPQTNSTSLTASKQPKQTIADSTGPATKGGVDATTKGAEVAKHIHSATSATIGATSSTTKSADSVSITSWDDNRTLKASTIVSKVISSGSTLVGLGGASYIENMEIDIDNDISNDIQFEQSPTEKRINKLSWPNKPKKVKLDPPPEFYDPTRAWLAAPFERENSERLREQFKKGEFDDWSPYFVDHPIDKLYPEQVLKDETFAKVLQMTDHGFNKDEPYILEFFGIINASDMFQFIQCPKFGYEYKYLQNKEYNAFRNLK